MITTGMDSARRVEGIAMDLFFLAALLLFLSFFLYVEELMADDHSGTCPLLGYYFLDTQHPAVHDIGHSDYISCRSYAG